jgi:hypothetical protein
MAPLMDSRLETLMEDNTESLTGVVIPAANQLRQ